MPSPPVIRTLAQQQALPFGAAVMRIVSPASDTGGAVGMVEYFSGAAVQPPPPLMTHQREDWTAWVLTGNLDVRFADREVTVPTGGTITIPRSTPFAWWTRRAAPLRLLLAFTPGGVEQFFVDVLELAKRMGPEPDPAELQRRVAELQARYGISMKA